MLFAGFSAAFGPSTSQLGRRAVHHPRVRRVAGEVHEDGSLYGRFQFSRDNPGLEVSQQQASGELNFMQYAKDKHLAERDPSRWCKDRCLATGYCEAIEDAWGLTTEDTIQFCKQCAGQDECAIDEYISDPAVDKAEQVLKSGFNIGQAMVQ